MNLNVQGNSNLNRSSIAGLPVFVTYSPTQPTNSKEFKKKVIYTKGVNTDSISYLVSSIPYPLSTSSRPPINSPLATLWSSLISPPKAKRYPKLNYNIVHPPSPAPIPKPHSIKYIPRNSTVVVHNVIKYGDDSQLELFLPIRQVTKIIVKREAKLSGQITVNIVNETENPNLYSTTQSPDSHSLVQYNFPPPYTFPNYNTLQNKPPIPQLPQLPQLPQYYNQLPPPQPKSSNSSPGKSPVKRRRVAKLESSFPITQNYIESQIKNNSFIKSLASCNLKNSEEKSGDNKTSSPVTPKKIVENLPQSPVTPSLPPPPPSAPQSLNLPPSPVQQRCKYKAGILAKCNHCGILSRNLAECERCKRAILPPPETTFFKDNRKGGPAEIVYLDQDEFEEEKPFEPCYKLINKYKCIPEESLPPQIMALQNEYQETEKQGEKFFTLTSDDVIKTVQRLKTDASFKFPFISLECKMVRVGDYEILSTDETELSVTFIKNGIYFEVPNYVSNAVTGVGIPDKQVLSIQAWLNPQTPYVKVTIGPSATSYVRKILEIDSNDCKYSFCTINGTKEVQKHLVFLLREKKPEISRLRTLYSAKYRILEEREGAHFHNLITGKIIEEEVKNSFLVPEVPVLRKPTKNNTEVASTSSKNSTKGSAKTNHSSVTRASKREKILLTPPLPQPLQNSYDGPAHLLLEYPSPSMIVSGKSYASDRVQVMDRNIKCLEPDQHLNDCILDFWLRKTVEKLDPHIRDRTYVYSSFFYGKLTTKPKKKGAPAYETDPNLTLAQRRYERVKRWTRKVDIFEKDYLIIPVLENNHWFMALITFPCLIHDYEVKYVEYVAKNGAESLSDNTRRNEIDEEEDEDEGTIDLVDILGQNEKRRPTIILFDSLTKENRSLLYAILRDYLKCELTAKTPPGDPKYELPFTCNKEVLIARQPSVPRQENTNDCGYYLLHYVEKFLADPSFQLTSLSNLREWFPREEVELHKRREIYNYILGYIGEHFPNNLKYVPKINYYGESGGGGGGGGEEEQGASSTTTHNGDANESSSSLMDSSNNNTKEEKSDGEEEHVRKKIKTDITGE